MLDGHVFPHSRRTSIPQLLNPEPPGPPDSPAARKSDPTLAISSSAPLDRRPSPSPPAPLARDPPAPKLSTAVDWNTRASPNPRGSTPSTSPPSQIPNTYPGWGYSPPPNYPYHYPEPTGPNTWPAAHYPHPFYAVPAHPHYAHLPPPPPGYADDRTSGGGVRVAARYERPPSVPMVPQHPYPIPPPGYGVAPHHLDPQMYSYYPPPPHMIYGAPYHHPSHVQPPPPTPPAALVPAAATAAPTARKRASSDEETRAPTKKRARKSASDGTNPAANAAQKRGGTAKNAKRDDARSGNQYGADGVIVEAGDHGPLHPELQLARCMSNRYKADQFPRCVACTRRWAGDTCRFQGIRFFLKNAQGVIVGASFVENQKPDGPNMRFPGRWNRALDLATIAKIKGTVARVLLPVLKGELQHLDKPGVICRPRDSDVRATCDTCMSSIFAESWLCRLCGREACAECYKTVRELTDPRPGASDRELAAQQARREEHAHANPFFLSCTRRSEHTSQDFSPTSRFHRSELEEVVHAMEALKDVDAPASTLPSCEEEMCGGGLSPTRTISSVHDGEAGVGQLTSSGGDLSPAEISAGSGTTPSSVDLTSSGGGSPWESPVMIPDDAAVGVAHPSYGSSQSTLKKAPTLKVVMNGASIDHECPTADIDACMSEEGTLRKVQKFTQNEVSEEQFSAFIRDGQPVVVTKLPESFTSFTPDWFRRKYGGLSCSVVDTQTEVSQKATMDSFFEAFGKTTGGPNKLKDWPVSGSFKTAMPELWDVLQRDIPFKAFCARDGMLNLASHFPGNMPAPELGPKMHCATGTFTGKGSRGTTRLHLDTADIANVMLYATSRSDGSPGFAVWDLFRAEDAAKIRKFLRSRQEHDAGAGSGVGIHDPILAGSVYLDDQMRKELREEYKVYGWRVRQYPGEAIFVPAGVIHQVANNTGCIKVAMDFVSPENITRCKKITDEFREQNQSMAWREDSLQLQTMMWFAWLSCARQEAELSAE